MILRAVLLLAVFGIAALGSLAIRRYAARASMPSRFDRTDVGIGEAGAMLVEFTSPYCYECQIAYPVLQAASRAYDAPLAVIDAKERPDLALKYAIRTTPTILVVNPKGKVTTGWFNSPSEQDLTQALKLAVAR